MMCDNCDGSGLKTGMKTICGCKDIDQRAEMVTLVMTKKAVKKAVKKK